MRRGSLLLNVTTLVGAQAAVKLINLAVSIAVVRYLGVQELGLYAYILAFAYPFGALADFGLATYAIREISRDRARELELVAILRRALLLLAGLVWVAMMGLATLLSHDATTLACLALAGLSNLFSAVTTPALVLLTAREDLHLVSLYQVAASLLGSAAIMSVLLLGGASLALFTATIVANGAMLVLAYVLVGPMPSVPGVQFSAAAMMVRQALPFGLLLVGFALYYRVDMVMLQWLRTTQEVGLYSAAYRFLDAVIPLAASLGRPFYPRFSILVERQTYQVQQILETSYGLLLAVGLPISIVAFVAADPVVLIVFGHEFVDAGTLLEILVWGGLPLFLVNIPIQALIAANRVMSLAGVYGASAFVNIALNLALIPQWGAAGAAASTVLCEWLNLVLVVMMVRREFAVTLAGEGLWRYGLATVAMAVVLWFVKGNGLLLEVFTGALVYATALIATGYRPSKELLALRKLLAQ